MARGTELAVGYVSLVAETSKLAKGIDDTLEKSGRDATKHGQRMGKSMSQGARSGFSFRAGPLLAPGINEASRVGQSMGDKLGQGIRTSAARWLAGGLVGGGVTASILALGGAFATATKSGVDFQTNLNKLQGVSQATAAQMAQISAKAKELGNDVNLTGVSAQNAAEAMTELVKGGFDVKQAMDAVRGTLQLATAAQVSAAQAATIQADALHAFGLGAADAAKVADVLANVSNASTGEITDFAYGLQAGGAVAHQFGLTIDDTATALGLLANAGIKGSDAGTLLKSALLAITDQGNPAQGAIQELGLTLYNAQGQFVGMRSLMDQLAQAAHRMTPELYQANTNILFGSDAARLSGIAAEQGTKGWDTMYQAIERTGSAQALAKANTQGIPGVFERLSNTADRAKLSIFELIDGPIATFGNALNTGINDALDLFESGGGGAFSAFGDDIKQIAPAVQELAKGILNAAKAIASGSWSVLKVAFDGLLGVGTALMPVFTGISQFLSNNSGLVQAMAVAWAAWKFLPGLFGNMNSALAPMQSRIQGAGLAMKNFTEQMTIQKALGASVGTNLTTLGSAFAVIESHSPAVQRMGDAYRNASTSAQRLALNMGAGIGTMRTFGAVAGTARAGLSGMSSAIGGIVGMLGGPLTFGITAAVTALGLMFSSTQQNRQRVRDLAAEEGNLIAKHRELYELLGKSGGQVDSNVIAKATEQVDILQQKFDTLRSGASIGDWLLGGTGDLFGNLGFSDWDIGKTLDKQHVAERIERIKGAMNDLGITSQQVGVLITGSSDTWAGFAKRLNEAGDGGKELLAELQPLRQAFLDDQAAAAKLTPGVTKLHEQMKVLADSTASAEEKTNALKTALDVLAGKQPDVQKAQDNFNSTVRETAQATQEVWDKTKGFGDALIGSGGQVNTATENGHRLYEALNAIKDATVNVAASGGDLKAAFSANEQQFANLAQAAGLTKDQVRQMAEQMGLVPDRITTLIELNGKDDTIKDLALVKTELANVPEGKTITVDSITQQAEDALKSVGIKVDHIEQNGHQQVVITSTGAEQVNSKIQSIIDTLNHVPSRMVMEVAYQQLGNVAGSGFNNMGEAQAAHRGIPYGPYAPGTIPYDPSTQPSVPHRAEGGPIFGTGPRGKDSVLMMGAPGEHMWTADEVAGAGGQQGVYALRALARSGKLKGLLPGFDQGGAIDPNDPRIRAIDTAYRTRGRPYDFGPWDCSMYMSTIYAAMAGKPPGRYFNTESGADAFAALGFKRGYKPGALNIGMTHGGPGGGHVAGTLPNGVNVENGPAGMSVYGPGARGAQDLGDQWYYDGPGLPGDMVTNPSGMPGGGGMIVPPGPANTRTGGGAGASPMDAGMFGAGVGAGAGSTGDPYGASAGATPGATGDGTDRTEGLIPAAAGNSAPAGTGAFGGLFNLGAQVTNGAIDVAAQAASMAAGAAANAFAPGSGAAASQGIQMGADAIKRGVSFAYQMGGIWSDALVEQLTPFGAPRWLSTDYASSFMPQIPNQPAGTTTAEDAVLDQKGIGSGASSTGPAMPPGDQHMPTGAPAGVGVPPGPVAPGAPFGPAPGPAVPAPSQSGIGGAASNPSMGPMANTTGPGPGGGGPQLDWLKGFGIFDSGGVLSPQSAAVNMGTTPEVVLTQNQWSDVATAAAAQPLDPAQQALDFSTHIGAVTVSDVDELGRKLDARGRLAMMRYAGRHKS